MTDATTATTYETTEDSPSNTSTPPCSPTAAPPRKKHRRSNITYAERNQPTVRFSKLRQHTDNLPAALLDALTSQVRNEVRAIRAAKNRGMTWNASTQASYDALDSITKASSPGEIASTIMACSALRKAESSLFLSELTWTQQRCRLLLHLRRDRRRVLSTAGTIHGTTREVLTLSQPAIESFTRMIDRLIDAAEVACGRAPKPKPKTAMQLLLEDAARGNYGVPNHDH
jgi:hypothetical protein